MFDNNGSSSFFFVLALLSFLFMTYFTGFWSYRIYAVLMTFAIVLTTFMFMIKKNKRKLQKTKPTQMNQLVQITNSALINALPHELWGHIFTFFGVVDRFNLQSVSKPFHHLVWGLQKQLAFRFPTQDSSVTATLIKCDPNVLTSVDLSHCQHITNTTLKYLAELTPKIVTLYLSGCHRIDENGLFHLQIFRNLRYLNLADSLTTDEGLEYVGKLTNLTELDLFCNNNITNRGLGHLKELYQLRRLSLAWCLKISDDGIGNLSGLTNLRYLDLIYCQDVTNGSLSHLQNLQKLKKLRLHGGAGNFNDTGVEKISVLQKLRHLNLTAFGNVSEKGVSHLCGLSRLAYLSFERANFDNRALWYIGQMKNLKRLHLSKCGNISSAGIKYLRSAESLMMLNLASCPGMNEASLEHLADINNLQSLNLSDCHITDDKITGLGRISKLTYLNLASNDLTSQGLLSLEGLFHLRELNLSFCSQITDDDLGIISRQFPNLEDLILAKCLKISDSGIRNLEKLHKLKRVDLAFCPVSQECVHKFAQAMGGQTTIKTIVEIKGNENLIKLPHD